LDETPPSKPTLRVYYADSAQAEAFARSLGVEADYGNRLDIADLSNEMLVMLSERSLPLPDQIRIDVALFNKYGAGRTNVQAFSLQGLLAINPGAWFWRDPIGGAAMLKRSQVWATDSPLHPLWHEAGHIVHYKAEPETYDRLYETDLTPRQKTLVASAISLYAKTDMYEFLAEVFAGLLYGNTYPRWIMRIYREHGGIVS
jgi:hypothetical protein